MSGDLRRQIDVRARANFALRCHIQGDGLRFSDGEEHGRRRDLGRLTLGLRPHHAHADHEGDEAGENAERADEGEKLAKHGGTLLSHLRPQRRQFFFRQEVAADSEIKLDAVRYALLLGLDVLAFR